MTRLRPRILLPLVLGLVAVLLSGEARAGEPYRPPLKDSIDVTSSFAEFRGDHLHNGIDFSTGGRIGQPVFAVDAGTVVRVLYDPDRYGKTVILGHRDGRRSWYSHLSRVPRRFLGASTDRLKPGDDHSPTGTVRVDRGETVGWSGRTGRGPEHLHLALERKDGTFLNPIGRFEPQLAYDPEPTLDGLRIYPLTSSAWVEGQAGGVQYQGSPEEPVRVWGKLGMDLTLWNQHRSSSSRSLPTGIVLRRDGRVVQRLDFDELSPYDQDTGVVTLYDRIQSNLTPTEFTLHATPRTSERWAGLEFTEEGSTGRISIELTTRRGTSKTYGFEYEVVPPPERVKWEAENTATERSDRVKNVRQATPNFRLASLEQGQFARTQYSPPSYESTENPSLRIATQWFTNRIRVDLWVKNRWNGWPQVRVEGDQFDTDLQLLQVEPGHFVGWWSPDFARDGWYEFTASLPTADTTTSVRDRVYVQSLRRNKPGAILSLDGRYSLFSPGPGLNTHSFVNIRPIERKPLRDELSYVEEPRRVDPEWLESTEAFELTVDLSDLENPQQIGLYQWQPIPQVWRVVSHEEGLTPTSRTARLNNPGTIALLRDVSPPEVGTPEYLENRNTLLIPVRENGSGIDEASLRAGDPARDVPSDWDSARNLLIVPGISPREAEGSFELTLVDRAGNRTDWSGEKLR